MIFVYTCILALNSWVCGEDIRWSGTFKSKKYIYWRKTETPYLKQAIKHMKWWNLWVRCVPLCARTVLLLCVLCSLKLMRDTILLCNITLCSMLIWWGNYISTHLIPLPPHILSPTADAMPCSPSCGWNTKLNATDKLTIRLPRKQQDRQIEKHWTGRMGFLYIGTVNINK